MLHNMIIVTVNVIRIYAANYMYNWLDLRSEQCAIYIILALLMSRISKIVCTPKYWQVLICDSVPFMLYFLRTLSVTLKQST